jgi:transcription initiation factor TFIIH subunit 4
VRRSELDAFTDARWKSILYFMVGIRFGEAELPAELRELLIESGLLQSLEGGAYRITSKGFRFLFESQRVQVWTLISGYLDTLERRRMRVDEVLAFLFQLSFLEFGVDYPVAPLSDSQKVLVLDMAKLGLVWLRTPTSRRFYATRLALNLAAPPSELGAERAADGNIVTESSFKIYVYDPSAFQTALLNLFCRLTMRLPNLLAGSITKRSVRNALKNGIAAAQIVDYLEHYSHPRMRREPGRAAVPDNVSNQIRLWEEERQRMHFTKALLVSLPVQRQFNDAVSVLSRRKKLLLSVAERKHIVIEESGEPYLRQLLGLDAGSA